MEQHIYKKDLENDNKKYIFIKPQDKQELLKVSRVKYNSDPSWIENPADKEISKKCALNNILIKNPELRPYLDEDAKLILTGIKSKFSENNDIIDLQSLIMGKL